jgi:hypothetical protein
MPSPFVCVYQPRPFQAATDAGVWGQALWGYRFSRSYRCPNDIAFDRQDTLGAAWHELLHRHRTDDRRRSAAWSSPLQHTTSIVDGSLQFRDLRLLHRHRTLVSHY